MLHQHILVYLGSYHVLMHNILVGILSNVLALFEFTSFNHFSISLLENSLNGKWFIFITFCFIFKIMRLFLYELIDLSTGSAILELQSLTKSCIQIEKIKQNRFFYGMFYSWFLAIFYRKTSKLGCWKLAHHQIQAF